MQYSGLAHFMDVPLKNYSSGMHMRLGFAIAANLDPDLLLLDEVFAVGDMDFQQQCIRTLQTFQSQGKTIVFVSHSPEAVRAICRRVCVLDAGRLVYDGDVTNGLAAYERRMSATSGDRVEPETRRIETRAGSHRGGARHGVAPPRRGRSLARKRRVAARLPAEAGIAAGAIRPRRRIGQPVGRARDAAVHATAPLLGL